MHNAHVFLGPSLPLKTAQEIFPHAYYHPPIQCGDIIRLLRLNPKLIVIIDGLYETTPAVWHKEILLALEHGIEVWGAASMGALRAAELHHYGMHGFGHIFHEFKEGILCDDDEVAVLHQNSNEEYAAINDAMINIRATCQKAWEEQIISLEAKNILIAYCKEQFYPYRSLSKATQHLVNIHPDDYALFSHWLKQNGILDVKKNDAIDLLTYLNTHGCSTQKIKKQQLGSMTCFLRELILFANTTPFKHQAEWLPKNEKQLYQLHMQSPKEYMLLAEIVSLVQKLAVFSSEQDSIDNAAVLDYIQKNQLYCPEHDFMIYKNHSLLSSIYSLICQSISLLHLTADSLEQYIPALAHYYNLPKAVSECSQKKMRIILVLIFSINQQVKHSHLTITKSYLRHHLKQLKNWRQYTPSQMNNWLTNPPVSRALFSTFLQAYLMASSVHALSSMNIDYYQWIYDVHTLCEV